MKQTKPTGEKQLDKQVSEVQRELHWRFPCSTGMCNVCLAKQTKPTGEEQLKKIRSRLLDYIMEEDMTKKEKEENDQYRVTGGYLKVRDYKEAWREAWDNLTHGLMVKLSSKDGAGSRAIKPAVRDLD